MIRASSLMKWSSSIRSGGLVAGFRKAEQNACARPLIVKYLCFGTVEVGCGWLKFGAATAVLVEVEWLWLVVFDLARVCCFLAWSLLSLCAWPGGEVSA